MSQATKPALYLAGWNEGILTLDDLIALYKKVTGKDPTPGDLEEARGQVIVERQASGRRRPRPAPAPARGHAT
jgi:hypothetical protein